MGYRSDVGIVTNDEGWKIIARANIAALERPVHPSTMLCHNSDTHIVFSRAGCYAGFSLKIWHDVKWYMTTDPEVRAIMEALDTLDDKGIPYTYVRIGEDITDAEERGSFDDTLPPLRIDRTIRFD